MRTAPDQRDRVPEDQGQQREPRGVPDHPGASAGPRGPPRSSPGPPTSGVHEVRLLEAHDDGDTIGHHEKTPKTTQHGKREHEGGEPAARPPASGARRAGRRTAAVPTLPSVECDGVVRGHPSSCLTGSAGGPGRGTRPARRRVGRGAAASIFAWPAVFAVVSSWSMSAFLSVITAWTTGNSWRVQVLHRRGGLRHEGLGEHHVGVALHVRERHSVM